MSDLEKAKQLLYAEKFTCVLCRDDFVYTSRARGVMPMVTHLSKGTPLSGFSAADKVVGKAAALLFVLAGVTAVYADIISRPALAVFSSACIKAEYRLLTDRIENRSHTGPCPMEHAVENIDDPREAFAAVQNTLEALRRESEKA